MYPDTGRDMLTEGGACMRGGCMRCICGPCDGRMPGFDEGIAGRGLVRGVEG